MNERVHFCIIVSRVICEFEVDSGFWGKKNICEEETEEKEKRNSFETFEQLRQEQVCDFFIRIKQGLKSSTTVFTLIVLQTLVQKE